VDREIVHQKGIDERAECRQGGSVLVRDRLLGEVARCHHQRRHALAEEMVQRRIRQHDADKVIAGRNFRRQSRIR
jgi:hypothetical protein